MAEEYFNEIMDNWINGNLSDLDKHDLIVIARYFENKLRENKLRDVKWWCPKCSADR